ncbi:hypothetical protein XA68_16258 [Ophiocordyceps unilateralis]|uniref:Carrier domain-containing protein n=1 Tax=Ophiocordyceps unilateralis TaxID=268505 RepID=A0A2A9P5A2_OPHUN|nr:hypothetical protein XA68_16258 [Ophiocordyceps unilateralis]
MQALADLGADLFLELDPKPVLCALGATCLGEDVLRPGSDWLPSLVPDRDEVQVVVESLAALHVRDAAISWHAYFHLAGCRRVDLPTYAFQRHLGAGGRPGQVGAVRAGGTWGLLCPAGQVPGAGELADALSRSGVRLEQVGQLGEAEGFDGLLGLWSSSSNVIDQTRHLRPKVDGAWHLHQLTRSIDAGMFVMLFSISGVLGMPGLAIYAAANTFLDSLAHLRRSQGLPATSLAYGTWQDDGMAAGSTRSTWAHLTQFGLNDLTPSDGLRLLERAVRSKRALTVGASLDSRRLRAYLEDRGGIPPLFYSLLGHGGPPASRSCHLREALAVARREQRADLVIGMVRVLVAKALGFATADEISIDQPLSEIGIDSLTAVLVRNHLAALTGLKLSANLAFLYPNILKALAGFFLSEMQDSLLDDTSSTPRTPVSTVSGANNHSMTEGSAHLDLGAIRKGCLDSSFTFENPSHHTAARLESVFVTGATGFIGAFIVGELLQRHIHVHCLVRADSLDHGRRRIVDTLRAYGLWAAHYDSLLRPLVRDMAQPFLGLLDDDFDHLALRLASRGRGKAVHLISTVGTVPRHVGFDVSEEDYEYNYATSKFLAERMPAAARWRGARASAYRIPFVTASSSTGHFRLDRGDFLHNLIVESIDMFGIIVIQDPAKIGKDFDFTNTRPLSFDDFFKLMIKAGAGRMIVPFPDWRDQALATAGASEKGPLARIAVVLDNCTDENAAAMFGAPPVGQHVLGGNDFPVPPVDDESVGKYINRIFLAQQIGT